MKEELEKKKAELEKAKEQLVANINYISGQIDLINSLLNPKPTEEDK
jgi:peptidoglycan hydrolase CwlO-like protein